MTSPADHPRQSEPGAGLMRRVGSLQPGDPPKIGPYQLVGLLGEGGMGRVYLGISVTGQRVAVKVVHAHLAAEPEFLRRFDREAKLARRVARFSTAEVLDVGSDSGRLYIVTEYVDGPTLTEAVQMDGPMAGADLDRVAVGVATALTAIHGAAMVHRDLKPSNVMLSRSGPLVIDFGIAHALDSATQITRSGSGIGTPAFMAPEQALGERVGPAADVFAWGGVVVYAATGRPPFGTGRPAAVLYRVVHGKPDLDGVSEPLRKVVVEAMRTDPAGRPTATQVLSRLLSSLNPSETRNTALSQSASRTEIPARPAQFLVFDSRRAYDMHPSTRSSPIRGVTQHNLFDRQKYDGNPSTRSTPIRRI